MADESDTNVLGLTAKIVSAHVGNNQVAADAAAGADPVRPSLIGHRRHGRHGRTNTGATDASRADPQIGVPRPHRLPGGREEAEDAQAVSAGQIWDDARAVPAEVGAAGRLSHGGIEPRQSSFKPREAERPWPKAGKLSSGTDKSDRAEQKAGPAGSAPGDTGPGTTRTRVQRLSSGLLFMSVLPSNNQSVRFLIHVPALADTSKAVGHWWFGGQPGSKPHAPTLAAHWRMRGSPETASCQPK